jgi:hypothetical protein
MKRTALFTLFCFLIFFFVGCVSTPPVAKPEAEYEQAKKMKTMITTYGFDTYAPDDFTAGEEKFAAGENTYDKDNAASKAAFDEAIASYKIVIHAGIAAKMKDRETEIDSAAKMADDIKADVATPEEYNNAKASYEKAKEAAAADNWEEASTLFDQAKTQYEDAYNKSKEKKDKAEQAMEASKNAIDDVASKAEELEKEGVNEGSEPEGATGTMEDGATGTTDEGASGTVDEGSDEGSTPEDGSGAPEESE